MTKQDMIAQIKDVLGTDTPSMTFMPEDQVKRLYDKHVATDYIMYEEISLGSSAGNLQKWIVTRNTESYYVKDRSQPTAFEPETEVFGYKLATLLGVVAVPQWLENIPTLSSQPASVSKDYRLGRKTSSLFKYMRVKARDRGFSLTHGASRYDLVISMLPEKAQLLHDTILYFDYIIMNPDRHLRNLEVFYGIKGEITGLVPAYDFGMGMYSSKTSFDDELGTQPYFRRGREQVDFLLSRNKPHTMKRISEEQVKNLTAQMYPASRSDVLGEKVILRLKELDLIC